MSTYPNININVLCRICIYTLVLCLVVGRKTHCLLTDFLNYLPKNMALLETNPFPAFLRRNKFFSIGLKNCCGFPYAYLRPV